WRRAEKEPNRPPSPCIRTRRIAMRTIAWASATGGARRSINSSPRRRRCRAPVTASKTITYHIVTRGLDPRVHRSSPEVFAKKMDGRVKPGHDGALRHFLEIATSSSHCALPRAKWYPLGLAGCGKTEQGSRSDSDPFTWGFGYVHGQNEFFRSLLGDIDE